jgi:excisionase family DNA binding protein
VTELVYYTPLEVAALLQVSTKSVYRWSTSDPTMPVLRIGGIVRFPRLRFEAWLRTREQGTGRARRTQKPLSGALEGRENTVPDVDGTGSMRHSVCQSSPELRVVRARRTAP